MGGISPVQLLIVLALVILLFGTKRFRSLGSDIGAAIKGFRSEMGKKEGPESNDEEGATPSLKQSTDKDTVATAQAQKTKDLDSV